MLRPLARGDATDLQLILNDPTVRAGFHNKTEWTLAEVQGWVARLNQDAMAGRGYAVGVSARRSGHPVGFARLDRPTDAWEVTFAMASQHQRQGYGPEAATELITWGFRKLGLDRIVGLVLPDNTASLGLMAKLGMVRLGECTIEGRDGKPVLWVEFELTREEWMRRPQAQDPPAESTE